jgi:hypothetical protein
VEWLAEEIEVLGESLPQHRFVHHKSHVTWPGFELGPPLWNPSTNLLNYSTAHVKGKKWFENFSPEIWKEVKRPLGKQKSRW